jgi:cob(I)alamin adenosyltransferase
MKGYIQIYTGDGKCKTTAALGLIMRATGAGLRVYFGQFIKGRDYSEIKILKARFPDVTVIQFGHGHFIRGKPTQDEMSAAAHGLENLKQAMHSGLYDIVIGDEACTAMAAGLFSEHELLTLCDSKPKSVELILTGRNAGQVLQARADLVTEMKCIKHYYNAGVKGRPGIES